MGNGSSQSVILGSATRSGGPNLHKMHRDPRYHQTPNYKYAYPHNRVLPKPIVGQRLRSTDNGHILHNAGTIRGLKSASPSPQDKLDIESEVIGGHGKRSEGFDKKREENCYPLSACNRRLFHSDPDISQSRPVCSYSPDITESNVPRRACGGAATRAFKLKNRKKTKAPEPPSAHTYQHHFDRSQSTTDIRHAVSNDNDMECRCINRDGHNWKVKNKAPAPPCTTYNPPPPPPLPFTAKIMSEKLSSNTEKTPNKTMSDGICRQVKNDMLPQSSNQLSSGKTSETSNGRKTNNNADDIKNDNELRYRYDKRNTIFNSKTNFQNRQTKLSATTPSSDLSQKEIKETTKEIANAKTWKTPDEAKPTQKSPENQLQQYYFSDKDAFKTDRDIAKKNSGLPSRLTTQKSNSSTSTDVQHISKTNASVNTDIKGDRCIITPGKTSGNLPSYRTSPIGNFILKEKTQNRSDDESKDITYLRREDLSDIDVKLRPVLPRKTLDVPKFSPAEAWQALGSPNKPIYHSSSEESIHSDKDNLKNKLAHRSTNHNDYSVNNSKLMDNQWTPRQDLDDSDGSSIDSEEVVIPKNQLGEFSTRFSLPTFMFSNMRPLGTDIVYVNKFPKNYSPHFSEFVSRNPQSEKHRRDRLNADMNAVRYSRRLMGGRNKYLSEEDISVSDSNWTFGGRGLQQKRGKQYSSDLMLSDRRKYEYAANGMFGNFFNDIPGIKDNHTKAKNKMKHQEQSKSKFSFYATDGQLMFPPESGSCSSSRKSSHPSVRGRQLNAREKFSRMDQAKPTRNYKKKSGMSEKDVKERSLDLVRILEDDARRKRNHEKISIRQQLQMMTHRDSDNGEDEEVDEAYFTEPKSLESSSPLHLPHAQSCSPTEPSTSSYWNLHRGFHTRKPRLLSSNLTHWTSSPALFECVEENAEYETKQCHSGSSVMSSPGPLALPNVSNYQRNQQLYLPKARERYKTTSDGDSSPITDRGNSGENHKYSKSNKKSPGQVGGRNQGREKKKHNSIYKQLMDIVRKEEKQLRKEEEDPNSRESSYSQRESSHSSSSPNSVSSSTNSFTGSSTEPTTSGHSGNKSGVPANKEFHHTSSPSKDITDHSRMQLTKASSLLDIQEQSSFNVSFVKPFTPNKSYKPVPFDIAVPSANCRMPTLQEGRSLPTEVS